MIAQPILVAQTPRAGRWNHVTLLPTQAIPKDVRVADFLGAAAFRPVGGNYLAAVRRVSQADSTKEGREVLILIGLRVPAGPLRDDLVSWLNERLADLGDCVAAVDWAAHDGSDYRLAVLDEWTAEAQTRLDIVSERSVNFHVPETSISAASSFWTRSLIMDAILAAMGAGVGLLAWNLFGARP